MMIFTRLCVLALFAAVSARGEDHFVMAAGPDDVLHGDFESFSKESVVLRRRNAQEPLAFRPEAVVAVEFDRAALPAADGMTLVRFNNGDALPGKVVSYTAEKTVLETVAGRVEMASGFVRSLDFASGGASSGVFGGVDLVGREADWKFAYRGFGDAPPNAFQIQEGKLVLGRTCECSRAADFSESFVLVIEAGANDQFFIALSNRDKERVGLRIMDGRAALVKSGGEENFVLPPVEAGSAHRRLFLAVDGAAKTITLTADGRVVGRTKSAAVMPTYKHITISCLDGKKVTLSRLTLVPGASGVGKAPAQDALALANRDQLKGKLVSLEGGQAVFEGEAGKFSIPVARLSTVVFSSKNDKMPSGGGARVLFSDLDGLTLRIDKVEGGRIKGQSEMFGPCEIGLDQVSRIEFQPEKTGSEVR